MKKLISCFYLMGTLVLGAQTLSNPSFETWGSPAEYAADTVPNQWWTMYCNSSHQTTDAFQGIYATRLQGTFLCGIAPGILVNGTKPVNYMNMIESGSPFTSKPSAIGGFYKYTEVTTDDSAEVTIILKKYNIYTLQRDTVGIGYSAMAAASGYTSFNVNINYLMPTETPDSMIIMFNSSKYMHFDPVTMALPNLYIDRIGLPETANGIEPINDYCGTTHPSVVFPNPMIETGTLLIKGDITTFQTFDLRIFDVSGKLVRQESISAKSTMDISRTGLLSGTYLYTIRSGNTHVTSGKFLID